MVKHIPTCGLAALLALPVVILAFGGVLTLALPQASTAAVIENPLGEKATFQTAITKIAKFALSIVGPLATIMIIVAAYLYMTGGGNEAQIKKAHQTLTWALIGIGIVVLAQGADLLVKSILGVK